VVAGAAPGAAPKVNPAGEAAGVAPNAGVEAAAPKFRAVPAEAPKAGVDEAPNSEAPGSGEGEREVCEGIYCELKCKYSVIML
jgi:hypothetical protein